MDFNIILEERLQKIEEVLGSKAKEYARGKNRYHNFTVAGQMASCTPAQALYGMMLKHMVSVRDLIQDHAAGRPLTYDLIDEKIGDHINYLILLEGMLKEDCWY